MSASSRQVTWVEAPTPRGSQPTTSKLSARSSEVAYCTKSTPDPPGPPGLTNSVPLDLPLAACFAMPISTDSLFSSVQSIGTLIVAHSRSSQSVHFTFWSKYSAKALSEVSLPSSLEVFAFSGSRKQPEREVASSATTPALSAHFVRVASFDMRPRFRPTTAVDLPITLWAGH